LQLAACRQTDMDADNNSGTNTRYRIPRLDGNWMNT
jgi:hypothetical protein